MDREILETFESVKRWKKSLVANARSGSISAKNWDACMSQLLKFFDFLESGPDAGMTPDDLLAEGLADSDKAKDRLMDWFNWMIGAEIENYDLWMKDGKPRTLGQNSAITYLGRIRGFFTHNKVIFGKWRMPTRLTNKTSKVDSTTDVFKYDEVNGEVYVDTPLLQQFLANLNFRDQTIALGLYSTSQDSSNLFELTLGWLREQDGEKRLFWIGNRTKTLEPFKVFFSREATNLIRKYVEQERVGASDDEPIWVVGKEYSYQRESGERINVGGGMNVNSINENFRAAAESMGVTVDGKPNPFRPKRFRHLFRTACTSGGVEDGVAQAFMGHKSSMSAKYLSQGKGFLLSQYVLVEPFLTVFKSRDQDEVQGIRADLNAARRERDEMGKKLGALEKEVKSRFGLTEDDLKALYMEMKNMGLGGGKALKPDFDPLTDLDEDELDALFIRALRRKMLG